MFTITQCLMQSSNTGYKVETNVTIQIDAKEFAKLKAKGHLGQLYGIDVSNEVYRLSGRAVRAHNPSVDDTRKASKGIKTISLTYYQDDVASAHQAGLECFKTPAGLEPKYGAFVNFLKPRVLATVTEYEGANALARIYGGF